MGAGCISGEDRRRGMVRCDIDACVSGLRSERRPGLSKAPWSLGVIILNFPCRSFGRGLERTKRGTSSEARYRHREVESEKRRKGRKITLQAVS